MKRRKRGKRFLGRGKEIRLRPYYTVIVGKGPTEWHATESTGPFSKLSRGAFDTAPEARAWARDHLGPKGWKIKRITETGFAKGSGYDPYSLRTARKGMRRRFL